MYLLFHWINFQIIIQMIEFIYMLFTAIFNIDRIQILYSTFGIFIILILIMHSRDIEDNFSEIMIWKNEIENI